MSVVVRVTLLSHAMTDAMAAGRFPADEPLNAVGRRQAATGIDFGAAPFTAVSGPEQRCLRTAELCGLDPAVEPRLADIDCRRWRGELLSDVGPADVAAWLAEPTSAPHGGESVADLMGRVAGWLESLTGSGSRTIAVTHPAVIRAAILLALDAPAKSFWRIDVGPVSRIELHHRGGAWTLRSL
ncbi:MAG: histidine phosphatase family protein [Mycobacterium sp.]